VAGGIPAIKALREGLAANRIRRVAGILNGTCNYILTVMREHKREFAEVLAAAQALGYAEADPAFDIDGVDAAHKLAILAALAFGRPVDFSAVHVEGIREVSALDIALAGELGYRIKLLGLAARTPAGISARVHPCMVPVAAPIARVDGVFNAVVAEGDQVGRVMLEGRGAGAGPTASAVVADMVAVAMGTAPLLFKRLRIFPDTVPPATTIPVEQTQTRYYLRLMCRDEPGVMGQVANILGQHGISLSAIRQQETDDGQAVPVVITTHQAKEGAMRASLEAINALPTIQPPTVCLRIVDMPKEFAGG
jgi:homoserine dehydrogenase